MALRFVFMLALLLSSTVVTRPARCQTEPELEALASSGVGFRHTTDLDLAAEANATGYGSGNDVSPGALSWEVRAGVLLPIALELDATARIGVGGLALGRVEERYFGEQDQIGSSLSVGVDASARFAPLLIPRLRLLVGPAAGLSRLAASSGSGMARADLFGIGLDVGARYRLHSISRVVDGHLELVLGMRRELPIAVRVAQGADDVLFTGTGGGETVYSFGIGVGYVFSFHERR
jgi:hypothetical protein